jgi:hypothetical protein
MAAVNVRAPNGARLNRWSLRRLRRYLLRPPPQDHPPDLGGGTAPGAAPGRGELAAHRTWKTGKTSPDPDDQAKASRILRLYRAAEAGWLQRHRCVVVCMDECGPLSLRPWPVRHGPPQRPWLTRPSYRILENRRKAT